MVRIHCRLVISKGPRVTLPRSSSMEAHIIFYSIYLDRGRARGSQSTIQMLLGIGLDSIDPALPEQDNCILAAVGQSALE